MPSQIRRQDGRAYLTVGSADLIIITGTTVTRLHKVSAVAARRLDDDERWARFRRRSRCL